MPRGARIAFKDSFYHVFNRGLNKQSIFLDQQDYNFFLHKLQNLKNRFDHEIWAFCLMPSHFHLLLKTNHDPLSKIISSLSTSYSMYFNRTHDHFGHLFQNRFKSILIEDDSYLKRLVRYIYLNPVKDNLASDPLDYQFSSLSEAIGKLPRNLLSEKSTQLSGKSDQIIEEFKQFIYDGIGESFEEIEQLINKDEAIMGTPKFNTFAQKKTVRRKNASPGPQ